MDIFSKKDPTKEEYLVFRCISIFGMKKIQQDKLKKIFDNEDNK